MGPARSRTVHPRAPPRPQGRDRRHCTVYRPDPAAALLTYPDNQLLTQLRQLITTPAYLCPTEVAYPPTEVLPTRSHSTRTVVGSYTRLNPRGVALTKLRGCPTRATAIVAAIRILQTIEDQLKRR